MTCMRKNPDMNPMISLAERPPTVVKFNSPEEELALVKRYDRRRSAEGSFSSIRRVLDEWLRSRRDDLRTREAMRKAVYNRLLTA